MFDRRPQRGDERNVAIDYYLKNDADTVKIEILDAQGKVVREFMGDATPPPAATDGDGFFGGPPARVGIKKGMNRFTWDMRFEGATVFPGMIMWAANPARGPLAPPSDSRSITPRRNKSQCFTIGIDKRLDAGQRRRLAEQFKLAARFSTRYGGQCAGREFDRSDLLQGAREVPRRRREIQAIATAC